jgi:hypothetical protein
MHRGLQRDQEGVGELPDVFAGDDRPNAGPGPGRICVDALDFSVRLGGADHVGLQRAPRRRQIVGITAASGQQRRIFLPKR